MEDNYVFDIDYPDASFTFEKKNMDKVVKLDNLADKSTQSCTVYEEN